MGISVYELFVLLVVPTLILWINPFVDVLRSDFTGNNKLIWFLAVTFVTLIGPVVCLFIGRKQKIRRG